MVETAALNVLHGCGLPQAWGRQAAWRILETRFDQGFQFLSTWQAWRRDPLRPRMLHYVSLTGSPTAIDDLLACAAPFPDLLVLAREIAPQWFGLLPGFHRLTLEDGQVLLTLCVGEVTTLLRQQQFVADSVYLDPGQSGDCGVSPWNVWTIKALARCCRRGTTLAAPPDAAALRAELTQCGFEIDVNLSEPQIGRPSDPLRGQFNPRWTIKQTRSPSLGRAIAPGACVVIGAGLAGASVAAALARRGWQVQVLDQGDAPAAGASGLPVGLAVPHVSADDCPLSRLSRTGVRLMLHQALSLLRQGEDWGATGTLERRVDGSPGLPDSWPAMGLDWSHLTTLDAAAPKSTPPVWRRDIPAEEPAIWHTRAAWLKPAQLVRAWLAQPGVTFRGNAQVAALRESGNQWEVLDPLGHVLARANQVVFANACGAKPLLETLQRSLPTLGIHVDQLPVMHGVRGQLSWAMHRDMPDAASAFPPFPVNGAGGVVPAVPFTHDSHAGRAWFVGSSYQPNNRPPSPVEKNHAANLGRLHKLLPALGRALATPLTTGAIHAWTDTRCVTADRLPVVGPLQRADRSGLWICAGMGSRGLSFSVLCAELLAARWSAEPLPVDAALAHSLDALRGTGSTSAPAVLDTNADSADL